MTAWLSAHAVEILGFVTGAVCVLLAARRSIWNFPIGIANNVVFAALFVPAALYADAGLQLVYLVLAVAGWIGWARGRSHDDRIATGSVPRRALPWLALAVVAATAVLWVVLELATDSTTAGGDAATTAGSLVAQYMLNRRWIQSWFLWIAVDVAYLGLYAVKGLWITAALYLLFIAMCVLGWRSWSRAPHSVRTTGARLDGPSPVTAP